MANKMAIKKGRAGKRRVKTGGTSKLPPGRVDLREAVRREREGGRRVAVVSGISGAGRPAPPRPGRLLAASCPHSDILACRRLSTQERLPGKLRRRGARWERRRS